jgi:dTDP-4-amino-4,6-dideoxygalactose transaminase
VSERDGFLPFHRPAIGDGEKSAVLAVLEGGWLTTGRVTVEFERAFAEAAGVAHAVAVNSGTAALHLAFNAIGLRPGDEVIVPTYTFAASAETVIYQGARPVLVDVDAASLNVDPAHVAEAMTGQTRAVEVVHFGGLPADVTAIASAIGGSSARLDIDDVPIIEDAAHAFPSPIQSLGGRFAGTIGLAGAFSFYATKAITTGEGGMLTTDSEPVAELARSMRLHGISRDAWNRYSASGSWYYEIEHAGFKDNLTDVAAAIGLVQLGRAKSLREARASIAALYVEGLRDLAKEGRVILPEMGSGDEHAWHLFVIRLGEAARAKDDIDRDLPGVAGLPPELQLVASKRARAIEEMKALRIGTSVHFIPLHLHPLYRRMGYVAGQFPVAEGAYAGAMSLPIWPGMTTVDVERVVDAVTATTA